MGRENVFYDQVYDAQVFMQLTATGPVRKVRRYMNI
jgi:hypothetical protein